MRRYKSQIRFRLMRIACLVCAPYWYLRIWLSSKKITPREYFLNAVRLRRNAITQPIFFTAALNISTRSFDAELVLDALKSVKSPYPVWALSMREIRLLLEAPIWLGDKQQFGIVANDLLQGGNVPDRISDLVAVYKSIASDSVKETNSLVDQMVLPAIHWERLSSKLEIEELIEESRDAMYQALRFVSGTDPRRTELVTRYLRLEAIVCAAYE